MCRTGGKNVGGKICEITIDESVHTMRPIIIYPNFDAYYYSFYLEGLQAILGSKGITYSYRNFPEFGGGAIGCNGLAFVTNGISTKRIYIAAEDRAIYRTDALEWCDVYAKVNVDPALIPPEFAEKILPIGPSFAVRFFPPLLALYRAVAAFRPTHRKRREHFANFYRQCKYRLPASAYGPGVTEKNYVFMNSSIWKGDTHINEARVLFIEACRSIPGLMFEGGFRPRQPNDVPGYEKYTSCVNYSHIEYIEKTKASAVVFNTPAVQRCHGWKLGEFLALGKAIVSTPLERLMPVPLEHGREIHFVDGSVESIRDAVRLICSDDAYRRRLERGAREYYDKYLSPAAVIDRILAASQEAPAGRDVTRVEVKSLRFGAEQALAHQADR